MDRSICLFPVVASNGLSSRVLVVMALVIIVMWAFAAPIALIGTLVIVALLLCVLYLPKLRQKSLKIRGLTLSRCSRRHVGLLTIILSIHRS